MVAAFVVEDVFFISYFVGFLPYDMTDTLYQT